jgi:spore coat polysaccharide biosynthesis predicted glycosyltransferase SpsG
MLFSILIGAAATLYFLSRALVIKAKVFFSGGRAETKSSSPFIIYCEGKQYWNVFKPVLDEFEKRNTALLYLTSSEDDPVFNAGYRFIKSEYIGEGNRAFAHLNLLNADFVLMTTPGLNVYQLKRSRMVKHYAHILHAASDATMYRMFGIDYFDSILLTGDYQAKDIRALEKIRGLPEKALITVGCSYLDVYRERMKEIPAEENHPFTVLVSPSWGPTALLSRFGARLLDPLVKTLWRVIVRPHPQSKKSEAPILKNLEEKYRDYANLEWDYERDNIYSLMKADIMISDFSGIIFDYVFLCDKPVMYVKQGFDLRPYDADDLGDNAVNDLWQFKILEQIGVELKEEYFDRIGEIIKNAADNPQLREARRKAGETAWQYPGESGKRVADFMFQTAGKVDG